MFVKGNWYDWGKVANKEEKMDKQAWYWSWFMTHENILKHTAKKRENKAYQTVVLFDCYNLKKNIN